MTDTYRNNLQVLQEGKEALAAAIVDFTANSKQEKEQDDILFAVEEIAGRKVMYARKEGRQIQLDSLYDSAYFPDTWFAGLTKLRFHSKVVLFGFGNGMYLRKLLQNTKKDVSILIYEPSPAAFVTAMQEFDLSDILREERIILLIKEVVPVLFGECLREFLQYEDVSGLIQSIYPNYEHLFPEDACYFNKELQTALSYEDAEALLWERHGKLYYNNTISNVKYLYQSKSLADLWEKLPKNLPAVIVAAGPSLDKNIEELKKAKGKCLMIAADSALNPLLRHDIIPDLFISIDGGKLEAHFREERMKQIPLVCNLQSSARLLNKHEAEKFFIRGVDSYVQEFMEERGIVFPVLKTGGSVANDCFELARILGLRTIIMVGQDLAYTGKKTHSAETVRGALHTNVDALQTVEVEGIDGRPILSSYEFQLYLHWFEERIHKYSDLKVIDATEGGAKIHGAAELPLAQAIAEECTEDFDVGACIRTVQTFLTETQQTEFKSHMACVPGKIEEAVSLIKKAIRTYEKLLALAYQNQYRTSESRKLFRTVNEITGYIENLGVMEYVQNHMQAETTAMLANVYNIKEDEKSEILEVCNLGKKYMQTMLKKAEAILPELKEKLEGDV